MNDFYKEITIDSFANDDRFLKTLKTQIDANIVARSKLNAVSSIVILFMFLAATPFHKDFPDISWSCIIIICVLVILRYASILSYTRLYPLKPKFWKISHYTLILMVGIFWGGFCLTVANLYGLSWVSLFFLFLMSGLSSAATTSFAPQKYLSSSFVLLVLMPLIVWCFIKSGPDTIPIGIGVMFYLIAMITMSTVQNKRYVDGFAKGYALKLQAIELRKARNEMEQRVHERTDELAQANKVLLESEQRYNVLFSGINDGVLVHYLPSTDQFEKFIEANDVVCNMLGYSRNDLYQMDMFDINAPDSPTHMAEIMEELKNRRGLLFEQTWVTSSKEQLFVEIHARHFEYKERQAAFYTIRDITERKKTQEMMIQAEKIMSVGGLAAGMAHEINNPLSGVLQTSQVLKKRLTEPIPANINAAKDLGIEFETIKTFMENRKIPHMVDTIYDSSKRGTEIVKNMLSFARKSSSEFYLANIPDLMDKTLDIAKNDYNLKKKFDFRNIKIQKEYQEDLPAVPCKSSEIQQVFFNILSNGAQAMSSMEIKVDLMFIIRISSQDGIVKIEIQDNGPGVDEKIRKRVFEPFFTTKPPGKGTGLGLSVSHMIVKNNHHGTMDIQSEPGNGTNFIIKLPLENAGIKK